MRKSGWYPPQRCWWQSVRVGRGSENGLKCLASFHAVLTSMTAITASSLPPPSLSHLLSLDSSLLFLSLVFWLSLSLSLSLKGSMVGWIYELRNAERKICSTWKHHQSHDSIIFPHLNREVIGQLFMKYVHLFSWVRWEGWYHQHHVKLFP